MIDFEIFPHGFCPTFTPHEMLKLGVFDGTYFNEFSDFSQIPEVTAKNFFASNVSLSREHWVQKGWITQEDPLGWFQWYVRFWHGRRVDGLDRFQIGRWRSFTARHSAQVKKQGGGNPWARVRQRQCLLHWASDPIPDINVEDKANYLLEMIK